MASPSPSQQLPTFNPSFHPRLHLPSTLTTIAEQPKSSIADSQSSSLLDSYSQTCKKFPLDDRGFTTVTVTGVTRSDPIHCHPVALQRYATNSYRVDTKLEAIRMPAYFCCHDGHWNEISATTKNGMAVPNKCSTCHHAYCIKCDPILPKIPQEHPSNRTFAFAEVHSAPKPQKLSLAIPRRDANKSHIENMDMIKKAIQSVNNRSVRRPQVQTANPAPAANEVHPALHPNPPTFTPQSDTKDLCTEAVDPEYIVQAMADHFKGRLPAKKEASAASRPKLGLAIPPKETTITRKEDEEFQKAIQSLGTRKVVRRNTATTATTTYSASDSSSSSSTGASNSATTTNAKRASTTPPSGPSSPLFYLPAKAYVPPTKPGKAKRPSKAARAAPPTAIIAPAATTYIPTKRATAPASPPPIPITITHNLAATPRPTQTTFPAPTTGGLSHTDPHTPDHLFSFALLPISQAQASPPRYTPPGSARRHHFMILQQHKYRSMPHMSSPTSAFFGGTEKEREGRNAKKGHKRSSSLQEMVRKGSMRLLRFGRGGGGSAKDFGGFSRNY